MFMVGTIIGLAVLAGLLAGPAGAELNPGATAQSAACPLVKTINPGGPIDPVQDLACALGALDVEYVTTYKRPNGTLLVKKHRGVLAVPKLLNVDDDILPDIIGNPGLTSTSEFYLHIDRAPLEVAPLPLSVDVVVNDPTDGAIPRSRLHLGYDGLASHAPKNYHAHITVGSVGDAPKITVTSFVVPHAAGDPLTLMGGLFNGGALTRTDPMGGRLTYTPAPANSSIVLTVGNPLTVTLTRDTPTTVDADVEIVEGTDEARITGRVATLPTSMTISRLVESADPDATLPQKISVTSTDIIASADFAYRHFLDGVQDTGMVGHAKGVPTDVVVHQTGKQIAELTTNGAFDSLAVGFANGEPVFAPVDGPYVKVLSEGDQPTDLNSYAVRLDGLKGATVDATDAVVAEIFLTPAGRKPLALILDTPGTHVDGVVDKLPEHTSVFVQTAPLQIVYDGHGQTIDDVTINGTSTEPFFGRATRIDAHAHGLPSPLTLSMEPVTQSVGILTVDIGQRITASAPVALVEFRGSDNTLVGVPGTGAGARYVDTVGAYQVAARVHDFRRVEVARTRFGPPELRLGATVRSEPFAIHFEDSVKDEDGNEIDVRKADAVIANLPGDFDLSINPPEATDPGYLDLVSALSDSDIGAIDVTMTQQRPFASRSDGGPEPRRVTLHVGDVPVPLHLDIATNPKGASFVASEAIGEIAGLVTDKAAGVAVTTLPDGVAGAYARYLANEFTVFGRLLGVREITVSTEPLDLVVRTDEPQDLALDAMFDRPDDDLLPAKITGGITDLPTEIQLKETNTGFEWIANGIVTSLEVHARNLPTGAGGAAFDGDLHAADLVINGLPQHFVVKATDLVKGVEALDGGEFGTVFVQISDDPAQGDLADANAPENEVFLFADNEDGTENFTYLRLHDLQRALYTTIGAQQTVDVAFTPEDDPALFRLTVDKPQMELDAEFEPPHSFLATVDFNAIENRMTYEASEGVDYLPLNIKIPGSIGVDMEFRDIPTSMDVCLAADSLIDACDRQMPHDIPATTSGHGSYQVPHVVTAVIETNAPASQPLRASGAICLKPGSVGDSWSGLCDYNFDQVSTDTQRRTEYQTHYWFDTPSTDNWVAFHDVRLQSVRAELYAGDSLELSGDIEELSHGVSYPEALEDGLIGIYLDTRVDPDDPNSPLSNVYMDVHGISYHGINSCYDPDDPFWDDFDEDDEDIPLSEIEAHMPPGCDIVTVLEGDGNFEDKDPTIFEIEAIEVDEDDVYGLRAREWKTLRDGESEIYDNEDPNDTLECGTDHAIRFRWAPLEDLMEFLGVGEFPIDITDAPFDFICPD